MSTTSSTAIAGSGGAATGTSDDIQAAVTLALMGYGTTATTQGQANQSLSGGFGDAGSYSSAGASSSQAASVYTVTTADANSSNPWATIAQTLYGTSNAAVIAQLQALTGYPAMAPGLQFTPPAQITYDTTQSASAALVQGSLSTTGASWGGLASLEASTQAAYAPQVAFGSNGDGLSVWMQGPDLMTSVYSSATGNWSAPISIDGNLGGSPSLPHLSVSSNGNMLVTWSQADGVYARRFVNGAWDASSTTIPLLGANIYHPTGAISDSGRAVVVFARTDGTRWNAMANYFNGTSWQASPTSLDDIGGVNNNAVQSGQFIRAAMDSAGNASVVWAQAAVGETAVSLNLSRLNAATGQWGSATSKAIENWNSDVTAFRIASADNGDCVVVWQHGNLLYANNYSASTNTWGGYVGVSDAATGEPSLSVSANGNAIVAWTLGNDAYVYAKRLVNGVWSGPEVVSNTALAKARGPSAAINDSGEAIVAFVENNGSGEHVFTNRYKAGAWRGIEQTESLSTSPQKPVVAIDSLGNAQVVMSLQVDGTNSIYARRFDASLKSHYQVPIGATWESVTLALYGTSDQEAVNALKARLGSPTLTAGSRLQDMPSSLTYTHTVSQTAMVRTEMLTQPAPPAPAPAPAASLAGDALAQALWTLGNAPAPAPAPAPTSGTTIGPFPGAGSPSTSTPALDLATLLGMNGASGGSGSTNAGTSIGPFPSSATTPVFDLATALGMNGSGNPLAQAASANTLREAFALPPGVMSDAQNATINAFWLANRGNPQAIIDGMARFGVDVRAMAYATGQSMDQVGYYLRAGGAAEGFGGWTAPPQVAAPAAPPGVTLPPPRHTIEQIGAMIRTLNWGIPEWNGPSTVQTFQWAFQYGWTADEIAQAMGFTTQEILAFFELYGYTLSNVPPPAPALPPGVMTAAQNDGINAYWLAHRGSPQTIIGGMEMYGVDVRALAYATGQSMDQVGYYLRAAGAPEGFGGWSAPAYVAAPAAPPGVVLPTATPGVMTAAQNAGINTFWLANRGRPQAIVDAMVTYGVGVRELAFATGQSMDQVGYYLKAAGAAQGFGGWVSPSAGTTPHTSGMSAAQNENINAFWLQNRGNPQAIINGMAQFGVDVNAMAWATGQSLEQVGYYLAAAGAAQNFGGWMPGSSAPPAAPVAPPAASSPRDAFTREQYAGIKTFWETYKTDPAAIMDAMSRYGVDVADLAYATGQSMAQVGAYLQRSSAPDGFGGWAIGRGYVGTGRVGQTFLDANSSAGANGVRMTHVMIVPPTDRSQAQWSGIKSVWDTHKSNPALIMQSMSQYGVDAADLAYATGQSLAEVGRYLISNGAADGFGGWSAIRGYLGTGAVKVSPTVIAEGYPAPRPQERVGALWTAGSGTASVAAIWNQYQADPYRLMQTMAEYGISAQELAQASGQSLFDIELYLSRAGAPAGFAGAEHLIDRVSVDSAFLVALDAASYPHTSPGGRPFDVQAFTEWYAAQDTQACRDFATLHGAHFSKSPVLVTPAYWEGSSDAGNWVWRGAQISYQGATKDSQHLITSYLFYSQASEIELLAVDFTLNDETNRDLLARFGSSNMPLPQSEYVERMRARYGSERATVMYRIQQASQDLRAIFAAALDAEQQNAPSLAQFRSEDAGVVLDSQNTRYTSTSRPWWSITQHTELDSNHETLDFDLQKFTTWYASRDTVDSKLFDKVYGSHVTTVHHEEGLGEGDYRSWTQSYIGAGGASEIKLGYWRAVGDQAVEWVPAVAAAHGLTMSVVSMDPSIGKMKLYNGESMTFDPIMGFVTAHENVDTSWWAEMLPIVFVGVVAGIVAGPAAATGAGFGTSGTPFVIASAGFGAAIGSVVTSLMTSGKINIKDAIRSAIIAMATAGFAEMTNLNGAGITYEDGIRVVKWAERLPAIGAQAVFNGLLSEITGGDFSQGFVQALANQLGNEVMQSINGILQDPRLSAEAKAAYSLMGRGISAALTVAADPENPMQTLAYAFVTSIGTGFGTAVNGMNTGSPSLIARDDEGNVMPGVVNPNSTDGQQKLQLYNQLRLQGLSAQEASQIVKEWVDSGAQTVFNLTGGVRGAPVSGDTPGVTNRLAFDDEGNLMPGIVDPNATSAEQEQQLRNHLISQGFNPAEAQVLADHWMISGVVTAGIKPSLQMSAQAQRSIDALARQYGGIDKIPAFELESVVVPLLSSLADTDLVPMQFDPIQIAGIGDTALELLKAQAKTTAITGGFVAGLFQGLGNGLIGLGQLAQTIVQAHQYLALGGDYLGLGTRQGREAFQTLTEMGKAIGRIVTNPVMYLGHVVDHTVGEVGNALNVAQASERNADWFLYGAAMGKTTFDIASVILGIPGMIASGANLAVKLVTFVKAVDAAAGSAGIIGKFSSGIAAVRDLTAVSPTASGGISATKFNSHGYSLNDLTALERDVALDIMINKDPEGKLTEFLTNSIAERQQLESLAGGKYGSNNGFDHVYQHPDGSVVIVLDSKQINNGAAKLTVDDNNIMQLSDEWIEKVLDKLDKTSPAWKAVSQARDNGTLVKGVIGVDKAAGQVVMIRVD